tara:strand:- start:886 stop:1158 length:273 start_codon:yes stop_codon:yes gene_type:complete
MAKYERMKRLVNPVLCTGLAMVLTAAPTVSQNTEKTYFDEWGFVAEVELHGGSNSLDIELGDFDGDGDLDIAVASLKGGLKIYENRIPRR